MNIFAIESDLQGNIDWFKSGQSLDNYRVVKMLLESAQLMCTTINELEGKQVTPYRSTHKNHPCTKWLKESYYHFCNLRLCATGMHAEFVDRFQKEHKCAKIIEDCMSYAMIFRFDRLWKKFNEGEINPPLCMPNQFKCDNIIESYRRFYASKPRMKYPKNKIPNWFVNYRGSIPFVIV